MEQKVASQISTDPADVITNINELAPSSAASSTQNAMNLVKGAKAVDLLGLGIDVAFGIADVRNLISHPTWANAAWVGADLAFAAWDVLAGGGGEAHAVFAGRIVAEHLPMVARLGNKARDLYEMAKGSEAVGRILEGYHGLGDAIAKGGDVLARFIADHPTLAAMLNKINPLRSETYAMLRGAQKKLLGAAAKVGEFATKHLASFINGVLHVIKWADNCGCVDFSKGLVRGTLSMFAAPICGVLCVLINSMVELGSKLFDWFPNAIEAYIGPPSVAREQFIR
jgi:hypothetical protein